MRDPETGGPHTAHTTNPVPVLLPGAGNRRAARRPARRYRADPAGPDGPGAAARDDRPFAAAPVMKRRPPLAASGPPPLAAGLIAARRGTLALPQPVSRDRGRDADAARPRPPRRPAARHAAAAAAERARRSWRAARVAVASLAARCTRPRRHRRSGRPVDDAGGAAAPRRAARLAAPAPRLFTPLLPLIERLALLPGRNPAGGAAAAGAARRAACWCWAALARTLEPRPPGCAPSRPAGALQAQLDAELPRLGEAQAAQRARPRRSIGSSRATRAEGRAAEDDATRPRARRRGRGGARGRLARDRRMEAERRAAEAQARHEAEAEAQRKRAGHGRRPPARARRHWPRRPGRASRAGRRRTGAPVSGTLVRGFGDATEAGPSSGLSYQAAAAARGCSRPARGRVVFAAPFRSFGQLFIVDCGGGYHFVLAGFDRLTSGGPGGPAGAPVGVMPDWNPRTSAGGPSLYVELRRSGQPVNPRRSCAGAVEADRVTVPPGANPAVNRWDGEIPGPGNRLIPRVSAFWASGALRRRGYPP